MSKTRKIDPSAPDEDNPLWTEQDFRRARPTPEILAELGIAPPRPPGRPKAENPKVQVTLRLDREVVEGFRAGGPGWQTRINAALAEALKRRA